MTPTTGAGIVSALRDAAAAGERVTHWLVSESPFHVAVMCGADQHIVIRRGRVTEDAAKVTCPFCAPDPYVEVAVVTTSRRRPGARVRMMRVEPSELTVAGIERVLLGLPVSLRP